LLFGGSSTPWAFAIASTRVLCLAAEEIARLLEAGLQRRQSTFVPSEIIATATFPAYEVSVEITPKAGEETPQLRLDEIKRFARIYAVFPPRCPDCGAEVRILAFLSDPFTVAGTLRHPGLPATAPPLTPARSLPPEDPA
jgi:hypothetical protein